jgi:predicted O-methyltransferase YrrM
MKRNFFILILYASMLSVVVINIHRFQSPATKPSLLFNNTEIIHMKNTISNATSNSSRQNSSSSAENTTTHYNTTHPDLCIVVSFRGTRGSDHYLKTMAHRNSAAVYSELGPRVRAYLAASSDDVLSEIDSSWQVLKDSPQTNEHGTPLFSSLLNLVADACPAAPLLAYANSDILFDSGLLPTLDALLAWNQSEMLAVGRRSNHDLKGPLSLNDVSKVPSELFVEVAQDYFIVTRRLLDRWQDLPGYVIGRRAYDNALVDWAYHHSVLVDLTATVRALHQTTADGNYAGHSKLNLDAEYNVQLPGAVYDHGSTGHAPYETVALDRGSVVVRRRSDNTVVASSSKECHYNTFSMEAYEAKRAEMEAVLASQGMTIIEGFSAQLKLQVQVYQRIFSNCSVKSIAEVGFNAGRSALLMLMANPVAEIQSFDLGRYNYTKAALAFLKAQFPTRSLQVDWGDSTVTLPAYHARNPTKTFDVAIVDGGHSYEVATADVINMRPLSRAETTILIVDDTPCQESYCVDRVIAEQEANYLITVTEKHAVDPTRGFLIARYNAAPPLLQLTSRGQSVGFDALRSPLFVTFGNHAYKEMLASFLCNLQLFPPMLAHTLVMVTDHATVDYLSALDTDAIIALHPDSVQSGHQYETPEYIRLMLLRGRLLTQLIGPARVVIWLEADAEYSANLLNNDQIMSSTTDLTLYWDGTMYGGGFIRFAATETARAFYADAVVARLAAEIAKGAYGTNDQELLNQGLASITFSEFDRCSFRSGMFYHPLHSSTHQARCNGTRPIVQQHNWVYGNANKIQMAKDHGAWFLNNESTTCKQRDLRAVVMTMDRPASLERLLLSLKQASYPAHARIDLQVSVDRRSKEEPHDPATMTLLNKFEWPHGVFETLAWPEPVGIFGQWVDSWPCELFPPKLYGAVVLLEDDLEVSPRYHEWFIGAHKAYVAPDMGAVTGMRAQLVARQGAQLTVDQLVPKGTEVFAYRLIATW